MILMLKKGNRYSRLQEGKKLKVHWLQPANANSQISSRASLVVGAYMKSIWEGFKYSFVHITTTLVSFDSFSIMTNHPKTVRSRALSKCGNTNLVLIKLPWSMFWLETFIANINDWSERENRLDLKILKGSL